MAHPIAPGERADSTYSDEGSLVRCCCGNLLARWVEGALELKCRRCKRLVLIPVPAHPALPPSTLSPADVGDDE